MFNSHVLEVFAGLCFIFIVVSLFVSTLNEWIAAAFALRAKDLETGLKKLLAEGAKPGPGAPPPPVQNPNASKMAKAILGHPLISNVSPAGLFSKKIIGPSYLSAAVFSRALLDLLVPGEGQPTLDQVRQSVLALQSENPDLGKALLPLVNRAANTLDEARSNLETWFDHAMERVGGRYKRRAHLIMFLIGFAIAVLLNISTINATTQLWNDQSLRQNVLSQAQAISPNVCNQTPADPSRADLVEQTRRENLKCASQLVSRSYAEAGLPIGWSESPLEQFRGAWLTLLVGWFLTALAACLGAPFWFDLLNKTLGLNARLSGAKPKPAGSAAAP